MAERARDDLQAAQRLKTLPAQAIPLAYFAAYHATQSLFWRLGIRCETHGGTIAFLRLLDRTLATGLRELHDRRWQAHYGIDLLLREADAEAAIAEAGELVAGLLALRVDDANGLFDRI